MISLAVIACVVCPAWGWQPAAPRQCVPCMAAAAARLRKSSAPPTHPSHPPHVPHPSGQVISLRSTSDAVRAAAIECCAELAAVDAVLALAADSPALLSGLIDAWEMVTNGLTDESDVVCAAACAALAALLRQARRAAAAGGAAGAGGQEDGKQTVLQSLVQVGGGEGEGRGGWVGGPWHASEPGMEGFTGGAALHWRRGEEGAGPGMLCQCGAGCSLAPSQLSKTQTPDKALPLGQRIKTHRTTFLQHGLGSAQHLAANPTNQRAAVPPPRVIGAGGARARRVRAGAGAGSLPSAQHLDAGARAAPAAGVGQVGRAGRASGGLFC